ncbi:MAG: hypothetical protein ACJAZM_000427 [Cyclobacteriaceae bacterium]|jgi:hypothetical protein
MEGKELLMTTNEFDVLDELYFVTSYQDLLKSVELSSADLLITLEQLHSRGWIKVLNAVDEEIPDRSLLWERNHTSYLFLATKSGLLKHNSI